MKARERNRLPDSAFGLPEDRAYPMYRVWGDRALPDAEHAGNAKARARQQFDLGHLSRAELNKINRKANAVLRECGASAARNPITAAEAKRQRRQLMKEIDRDLRDRDRAQLAALRTAVKGARASKRAQLKEAREQCAEAGERYKQWRDGARVGLRRVIDEQKEKTRDVCRSTRLEVGASADVTIARALAELEDERRHQATMKRSARAQKARATKRASKRERRAESDDAVRHNLPPELVPVFDEVRRDIKASAHRSRTESFLEWVEDNEGEVLRMQADSAADDAEREIAEHMAAEWAAYEGAA